MKLILSLMLVSSAAQAQVFTPPPPSLVNAEIQVHLKDGKVTKYSENQYKVVPRSSSKQVQAKLDDLRRQLAECQAHLRQVEQDLAQERAKPAPQPFLQQVEVEKPVVKYRNRFAAYAGAGPDGLAVKATQDGQDVKERYAPMFGVGYQRLLDERWSLGGQLIRGVSRQSHTYTGMMSGGYDF